MVTMKVKAVMIEVGWPWPLEVERVVDNQGGGHGRRGGDDNNQGNDEGKHLLENFSILSN